MKSFQQILSEQMEKFPLTADERAQCKAKFGNYGCTIAKNGRGEFFAYTHRARSKFYPSIAELPKEKIDLISDSG
jgi:hypothetical protein